MAQILIADDNPDITLLLGDYLKSKGHRVLVVNDGLSLARKAAEHQPHLIVADIQMPGAYGNTVYEVLQKDPKTAGIPMLFISAHSLEKIGHLLPKDPKTRYLKKPVQFPELDKAIAELLPLGGYRP